MSSPAPVQSFVAGICLVFPVHFLMLLNGNVFGISGFFHRAVRQDPEACSAVLGLVVGGIIVGLLQGTGQPPLVDIRHIAVSGVLVGLGTKLSNGCTSGHMLCGLSCLSPRSFAATVTFFITGAITANLVHHDSPPARDIDWSLGPYGKLLLLLQVTPLLALLSLYYFAPVNAKRGRETRQNEGTPLLEIAPPQSSLRLLTCWVAGIEFAIALCLSGLTDPLRVVSFLLLPFHPAFDVSLAFLALGALPLGIILYRYGHGAEKPRLGGQWAIPRGGDIDAKLLVGAAIFGSGWGLAGICPGPGLVNLGQAIVTGTGLVSYFTWLVGIAVGGLFA